MYYEVVAITKDGKEKVLHKRDTFLEAVADCFVHHSMTVVAIDAYNRDHDLALRVTVY